MSDPVRQADINRDAAPRRGLRRRFDAWRIRRQRAELAEAHDPTDAPDGTQIGRHAIEPHNEYTESLDEDSGIDDLLELDGFWGDSEPEQENVDGPLLKRPAVAGGTTSNWIRVYDSGMEVGEVDLECLRGRIALSWWEFGDFTERVYRLTTDDGRTLDMPLPGDRRRLALDSIIAVYRSGEHIVAIDVCDSNKRYDRVPPGPNGVLRQWLSGWCDSLHWILLDSPDDQAENIVHDAEQLPWCIGAWFERHPYGTLLCLASKHLPPAAVEPILVELAGRFGGVFDGSESLCSPVPKLNSTPTTTKAVAPAEMQPSRQNTPILDGSFTEYHPNGRRKCRGTRVDGHLIGGWTAWFEDGTLRERGEFLWGEKIGTWQVRDSPDDPVRTEQH